jgi:hypothetical protein
MPTAKPKTTPDSALLTEAQLAQRWGVSRRTLQAARQFGCGCRYVKISSCVRYRLVDIAAYELANLRTRTSEYRRPPLQSLRPIRV